MLSSLADVGTVVYTRIYDALFIPKISSKIDCVVYMGNTKRNDNFMNIFLKNTCPFLAIVICAIDNKLIAHVLLSASKRIHIKQVAHVFTMRPCEGIKMYMLRQKRLV